MRTIYIADDGTQFDDEYEYEDYEFALKHPKINDIIFLDKDQDELNDPYSVRDYNETNTIIVPDQEAADQLIELGTYTCFSLYEYITSAGTWEFKDDPYDPKFIKVSDVDKVGE